jgi:hypothetical protein
MLLIVDLALQTVEEAEARVMAFLLAECGWQS